MKRLRPAADLSSRASRIVVYAAVGPFAGWAVAAGFGLHQSLREPPTGDGSPGVVIFALVAFGIPFAYLYGLPAALLTGVLSELFVRRHSAVYTLAALSIGASLGAASRALAGFGAGYLQDAFPLQVFAGCGAAAGLVCAVLAPGVVTRLGTAQRNSPAP